MPDVEIDATGLLQLINRMQARVQPIANEECLKEATKVVSGTQGSLPHISGELADSLSAAGASTGATITWTAPYAAWIEYGGSRGRALVRNGRYLGPQLDGAGQRIGTAATRRIEQEARQW